MKIGIQFGEREEERKRERERQRGGGERKYGDPNKYSHLRHHLGLWVIF